jgi:hypothetical protein
VLASLARRLPIIIHCRSNTCLYVAHARHATKSDDAFGKLFQSTYGWGNFLELLISVFLADMEDIGQQLKDKHGNKHASKHFTRPTSRCFASGQAPRFHPHPGTDGIRPCLPGNMIGATYNKKQRELAGIGLSDNSCASRSNLKGLDLKALLINMAHRFLKKRPTGASWIRK